MKRISACLAMVMVLLGALPVRAQPEDMWLTCDIGQNEAVAVSSFPTPPYRVPAAVDAAGNQDGIVCAKLLPETRWIEFEGVLYPVYLFGDNSLGWGTAN